MTGPSVMIPSARAERPGALAISPTSTAPSPGSGASTPTSQLVMKLSASSPQPLVNIAATPGPQSGLKPSITSKEWVVPPRPKPGRKPATDTPPTKRKAQNRAAQRAFRERRAARVGELEEQIEDQRRDADQVERDLQDRINGLDTEVHHLRDHCSALEDMLEKERLERSRLSDELEATRRRLRDEQASASARHGTLPGLHTALSQHQTPRSSVTSTSSHRNSSTFAISQLISANTSDALKLTGSKEIDCGSCDLNGPCQCAAEVLGSTNSLVDCGKCSLGTRCECLEAALNSSAATESELKRRPSSISPLEPEEKRHKPHHTENEIDFTAMFSKKPQSNPSEPVSEQAVTIPPRDSCGFCTEGTYCMCAEAAAAAAAAASETQSLAPIGSQVQTPPPSEHDVGPPPLEFTSTGAVKLPRLSSLNRPSVSRTSSQGTGCGASGPGTCAQCLADPKSGLFCRSLAANFEKQGGGGGCCGGSAGGGCCKNKSTTSAPSVSLSCADTYKTLASHRDFDRASEDIGTWLPKLRAVPRPQEVGESSHRRLPIEVETASIMSVLKGFDVRFGRDA